MTATGMNPLFDDSGRSSPTKGRILPSTTADVQAAIAAIRARGEAFRRGHEHDQVESRSFHVRLDGIRQPHSLSESFDSDGDKFENDKYFANIGDAIDHKEATQNCGDKFQNDRYFTNTGDVVDHIDALRSQSFHNDANGEEKLGEESNNHVEHDSNYVTNVGRVDEDHIVNAAESELIGDRKINVDQWEEIKPMPSDDSSVRQPENDRYATKIGSLTDHINITTNRSEDDFLGMEELSDAMLASGGISPSIRSEIGEDLANAGNTTDAMNGMKEPRLPEGEMGVETTSAGSVNDQTKGMTQEVENVSDQVSDVKSQKETKVSDIGSIIDRMNGVTASSKSPDIGSIIDKMNGVKAPLKFDGGGDQELGIERSDSEFSSDISSVMDVNKSAVGNKVMDTESIANHEVKVPLKDEESGNEELAIERSDSDFSSDISSATGVENSAVVNKVKNTESIADHEVKVPLKNDESSNEDLGIERSDSDFSSDISSVMGVEKSAVENKVMDIGSIIDKMNGVKAQDIATIIDKMNGVKKSVKKTTGNKNEVLDIKFSPSDFSSDISNDGSFDADFKVSSAAQVGIAAFIDSLANDPNLEENGEGADNLVNALNLKENGEGADNLADAPNLEENGEEADNLVNDSDLEENGEGAVSSTGHPPATSKDCTKLQEKSTIDSAVDHFVEPKNDDYAEVRPKGTIDSCIGIEAKTQIEKYAQNEEDCDDDHSIDEDVEVLEQEPAVEKFYDDDRVLSYIGRVTALAQENTPSASRLDNIMFYARREGIPLLPLIDAFDQCRADKAATDATRLTHYIREAITLLETTEVTYNIKSKLLREADNENVDIALLKQMLSHPEKHVKFVGYDPEPEPELEPDPEVELEPKIEAEPQPEVAPETEPVTNSEGGNGEAQISKSKTRSLEEADGLEELAEEGFEVGADDQILESVSGSTDATSEVDGHLSKSKTRSSDPSTEDVHGVESKASTSKSKSLSKSMSKSKSMSRSKTFSKSKTQSLDSVDYMERTFDTAPSLDDVNFVDEVSLNSRPQSGGDDDKELKSDESVSRENGRRHYATYLKRKREQLAKANHRFLVDTTEAIGGLPEVDAVDATKVVFSRKMFKQHPSIVPFKNRRWTLPKDERTRYHDGYKRLKSTSLVEKAIPYVEQHELEHFEWAELEFEMAGLASYTVTNERWFGTIIHNRLNFRTKNPFVKDLPFISMNKLVYPKLWEEEWYTSWLARKQNPGKPRNEGEGAISRYTVVGNRPSSSHSHFTMSGPGDRHEFKDKSIGKIYSMRYRAGERLSKVHWDYSSFLFKSRWRKKYYPKGIF